MSLISRGATGDDEGGDERPRRHTLGSRTHPDLATHAAPPKGALTAR